MKPLRFDPPIVSTKRQDAHPEVGGTRQPTSCLHLWEKAVSKRVYCSSRLPSAVRHIHQPFRKCAGVQPVSSRNTRLK